MPTANEVLSDLSIRHAIDVRRYGQGEVRKILQLLDRADRDLVAQLRTRLARLPVPVDFRSSRLLSLLADVDAARDVAMARLAGTLGSDLEAFSSVEAAAEQQILAAAVPIEVEFAGVSLQQLRAVVHEQPFQGRLLGKWHESLASADKLRLRDAIQLGYAQGESVPSIVRRVAGTRANQYRDGALSITRQNAEAVVRTGINHVSNAAREAVWEANSDIIAGEQWLSTLDGRTCLASGSMVLLSNGNYVPIEEVQSGQYVVGGLSGESRRVIATTATLNRRTIRVSFSNGSSITCTPDHPFLTPVGWVEAEKLHVYGLPVAERRKQEGICGGHGSSGEANLGTSDLEQETKSCNRECHTKIRDTEFRDSDIGAANDHAGRFRRGEKTDPGLQDPCARRVQSDSRGRWGGGSSSRVPGEARSDGRGSGEDTGEQSPYAGNTIGKDEGALGRRVRRSYEGSETFTGVQDEDIQGQSKTNDARAARAATAADEGQMGRSGLSRETAKVAFNREVQEADVRQEQGTICRPRMAEEMASQVRRGDGWVSVVSVEPGIIQTVYDIQVDVDESFVCAGLVVHNSAICRARDGKVAPVGDKPLPEGAERLVPAGARPPAHLQCRSLLIAIFDGDALLGDRPFVRTTQRYGAREVDFRREARRSGRTVRQVRREWTDRNVGTVAAKTTYGPWLRRQPAAFQDEVLGKTKGALFRRGGLEIDKFVDRVGNELSLSQLAARHPSAFLEANIDLGALRV